MGLADCFEGIICFETLNPPQEKYNYEYQVSNKRQGEQVAKPRILCKPSLEAMEAAIRIANVDPKKTVIYSSLYL